MASGAASAICPRNVSSACRRSAGNAARNASISAERSTRQRYARTAAVDTADPLWIGGTRLYGTVYAPQFVEFTLNEIEVFDVALTQAEIQAIGSALAGKCKPTPTPSATRTRIATATRTPTRTPFATPTATGTATAPGGATLSRP